MAPAVPPEEPEPVEELQLVEVPKVVAVRPYCGAKLSSVLAVQDTRLEDGSLHGHPLPAWVDVGLASHMRGFCGLVPAPAAWSTDTKATPKQLRKAFDRKLCLYRLLIAGSSVLESVSCWVTVWEIAYPEKNLYNKFEAYELGLPGIDRALGVLSAINSLYLFMFFVMVSVFRCDLYRALACGRLVLSFGTGFICMMLVFISESTKVFPFVSTLCSMLYFQAVLFGLLVSWRGKAPSPRTVKLVKVVHALFFAVTAAWCLMYALDGMAFLREDSCRATKNRAMPVRIRGVSKWQCAAWGKPHDVRREPASGTAVLRAQCLTSFHIFDMPVASDTATVWTPSQEAHYVLCPPSCQQFGLATDVMGCRVYDARSSICAAAVQMGMISASTGGLVTAVGRSLPATLSSCQLNSVMSVGNASAMPGTQYIHERGSEAERGPGAAPPALNVTKLGAFYFQGGLGMGEEDVVTLHGFRKLKTPGAKKPYLSYVADVSWRIGGGDVQTNEIVIGPSADAEAELNFCRAGGNDAPNRCE